LALVGERHQVIAGITVGKIRVDLRGKPTIPLCGKRRRDARRRLRAGC